MKTSQHILRRFAFCLLPLWLTGCVLPPQYSIVANGERVSETDYEGRSTMGRVRSRLENPLITGRVKLPRQRFEHPTSTDDGSCCSRVTLRLDGPFFTDGETEKAVRLKPAAPARWFGDGASTYEYEVPSIRLPVDGSIVNAMLIINGERVLSGEVSLQPETLVLPVHVHLFAPQRGSLPWDFSEEVYRGWVEPPAFDTSITTRHSLATGTTETDLIAHRLGLMNATGLDSVWSAAGIQFKLGSFEIIRQDLGLERELISAGEQHQFCRDATASRFGTGRFHQQRRAQAGIHIYIGGSINSGSLLATAAGSTCGPGCTRRPDLDNVILLDRRLHNFDGRRIGDVSRGNILTAAHEIGHYLGLEHVEFNEPWERPCGRDLLPAGDLGGANLMAASPAGTQLTPGQIERVRAVAIEYLALWR